MTTFQMLSLLVAPVLALGIGGLVYWTNARFNR
jgi:hypothetical protein